MTTRKCAYTLDQIKKYDEAAVMPDNSKLAVRTSKERVSTADLEACRSWLVARGDSLARSRDMILMVDELLERRSSETDDVRSVLEEIVARVNERPRGVTKNHPLIARAREVLGPPTTPKASEGRS